ncbi:hypothetical protein T07_14580 [Trichinella nelsoni]|uniref:Uncharacterized protein n=1 Tax=Trichinella nelsoni TaxID=6336 RepID=A0A0V0RAA4_9BILA|nr:hypothetical protein T07_14580 [Trichinella nelsoni]
MNMETMKPRLEASNVSGHSSWAISLLGEEDSSGNTLTGAKHSNALCHGSK